MPLHSPYYVLIPFILGGGATFLVSVAGSGPLWVTRSIGRAFRCNDRGHSRPRLTHRCVTAYGQSKTSLTDVPTVGLDSEYLPDHQPD
jgi:hypothetical protein